MLRRRSDADATVEADADEATEPASSLSDSELPPTTPRGRFRSGKGGELPPSGGGGYAWVQTQRAAVRPQPPQAPLQRGPEVSWIYIDGQGGEMRAKRGTVAGPGKGQGMEKAGPKPISSPAEPSKIGSTQDQLR